MLRIQVFLVQIIGKTLIKREGRVEIFIESSRYAQPVIDGTRGIHPFDNALLWRLQDSLRQEMFRVRN